MNKNAFQIFKMESSCLLLASGTQGNQLNPFFFRVRLPFFLSPNWFSTQHYHLHCTFTLNKMQLQEWYASLFFFLILLSVSGCCHFLIIAQHNYKVDQIWGGSAIPPEINKAAFVRERCQHGKHVSNNEDEKHATFRSHTV